MKQWWKGLSMKAKTGITLLGSIASIAAFFGINAIAESTRIEQNINAPNSQNINVQGNATITHTVNSLNAKRGIGLMESYSLTEKPDIYSDIVSDCVPIKGDSVEELQKGSAFGQPEFLTKVRIKSGKCSGVVGWIPTNKLERQ